MSHTSDQTRESSIPGISLARAASNNAIGGFRDISEAITHKEKAGLGMEWHIHDRRDMVDPKRPARAASPRKNPRDNMLVIGSILRDHLVTAARNGEIRPGPETVAFIASAMLARNGIDTSVKTRDASHYWLETSEGDLLDFTVRDADTCPVRYLEKEDPERAAYAGGLDVDPMLVDLAGVDAACAIDVAMDRIRLAITVMRRDTDYAADLDERRRCAAEAAWEAEDLGDLEVAAVNGWFNDGSGLWSRQVFVENGGGDTVLANFSVEFEPGLARIASTDFEISKLEPEESPGM